MSKALSDKARAFLQERRGAVLGTINRDGSPQQSAIWYQLLEDDSILICTQAGRVKERNLRRDPRVSICFEDGAYITMTGKATLIDDPEQAQQHLYRIVVRYRGEEAAPQYVENRLQQGRVV